MEYFVNMIYEQWYKDNLERALFFNKGEELSKELSEILSFDLSEKIYTTFCESCMEVEKNAFIDGFCYACKCLSTGKINLKVGAEK